LSKSLSFETLVDKYNFLLQFLLKINAYFSRFHCNKILPLLYICSSFRTAAGLWPKKCGAGRVRVGLFCGAGRVRVVSVGVRGLSRHDFWNSCGCGAVADKKFNPCRTLISSCQKSSEGSGSLRTKSCQTIKQTNLYSWLRFTSGTCGLAFRFRVNV